MVINWIKETFNKTTQEETYADRLLHDIIKPFGRKEAHMIKLAYEKAAEAHQEQFRDSGDPYIIHPLEVAKIIVNWMPDHQAVMAAILHDTIEDTYITEDHIREWFGDEVLHLVQGVTKLSALRFRNKDEMQAESFRNMLVAISQDLRVILVKLADRLHNMRTLGSLTPNRQYKIALETKTIYAPIASRLGLNKVWSELQEYCFQYLHPWRYGVFFKAHTTYQAKTEPMHDQIISEIQQTLHSAKIKADVHGRFKMLSSIYSKMQQKSLRYEGVHDKEGFRILVENWDDVYRTLGHIHQLYRPVPGLFKDYIAIPKSNGYQSLHTIVIGPHNNTMEIQIRTKNMHTEAENGHANHWQYKHSTQYGNDNTDRRYQWLQSLLHLHQEHEDTREFIDHVKLELFHDDIYVFSPRGDVIALPKGSTLVDFAFAIHSEKGLHFDHGLINGRHANPETVLHNGDRIMIMTHDKKPLPELFLHVHTARARSALRKYFKDKDSTLIDHARQQLIGITHLDENTLNDRIESYSKERALSTTETLILIGLKRLHPYRIAHPEHVLFKHHHPWLQRAACCQPLPGDDIVSLPHQETFEVHKKDCKRAKENPLIHTIHWDEHDRHPWETTLFFPIGMSHHDMIAYCSKHDIEIISNERKQDMWIVKALTYHRRDVNRIHEKFGT